MYRIKPILTDLDYQEAVREHQKMNAKYKNTAKWQKMNILGLLIKRYEKELQAQIKAMNERGYFEGLEGDLMAKYQSFMKQPIPSVLCVKTGNFR